MGQGHDTGHQIVKKAQKSSRMRSLISMPCTNVTDGLTEGQTNMHRTAAYATHSVSRQNLHDKVVYFNAIMLEYA